MVEWTAIRYTGPDAGFCKEEQIDVHPTMYVPDQTPANLAEGDSLTFNYPNGPQAKGGVVTVAEITSAEFTFNSQKVIIERSDSLTPLTNLKHIPITPWVVVAISEQGTDTSS